MKKKFKKIYVRLLTTTRTTVPGLVWRGAKRPLDIQIMLWRAYIDPF
jgi:hypothetical protein